jgi:hypothetical protein
LVKTPQPFLNDVVYAFIAQFLHQATVLIRVGAGYRTLDRILIRHDFRDLP